MPNRQSLSMSLEGGFRAPQHSGFGLCPGGQCLCPNCGAKTPHQTGIPCYEHSCPECGQPMTRNR